MSKAKNIVTSKEVDIAAPAMVVWEVLTDLSRYREWNPFTVKVESTLKLNEPVDLYIPIPGQPGQEMTVRKAEIRADMGLPEDDEPDAAARAPARGGKKKGNSQRASR